MRAAQTIPPDRVRLALHAGQAEVYAALRRVDQAWVNRFRVLVAGRRYGKTHEARVEMVARALALGPGRYWYVAPTLKAAKDIFWSDLKAIIHPSWHRATNESELWILLRNGAELRLHGAEHPGDLVGRKLRFCILDEFGDMKPEIWSEAIRPSLADHKAPALFIGTPTGYNHLHDFYQRGQSTDPRWALWASWQRKSIENPTLDPAEIEDARQTTDPRTFRQEWEASFEALAGRAYYAFQRQHHVAPVTLDPHVPVSVSFDFNIHPATAIIGQKIRDEARVWREVWIPHAGGEATRASATRAKQLLTEARWQGQVRIYGDPAGVAGKTTGPRDHAVVREVFPNGIWNIARKPPHVKDRVAAVNTRCETMAGTRSCLIDPSCTRLIADLEQVTFRDNGDLEKLANPMLTHVSDAFGYWVVADWPVRATAGAVMGDASWL